MFTRTFAVLAIFCGVLSLFLSCNPPENEDPVLRVGAIPDQEVSELNRRFEEFTSYLETELDVPVEYEATQDYRAVVEAFERGDIDLAWFGALTGVEARNRVDGARAIAQREMDQSFQSVFIAHTDSGVETISDLKGKSFTFGSEQSTSGHLSPRKYLLDNGIHPEQDFENEPNYSGSHDRTWKLVQAGTYDAGALNEAVWERAREEGDVSGDRVYEMDRSHEYANYNWTAHPQIDEKFGDGTIDRLQEALINMGEEQQAVLDLFSAEQFIESSNEAYSGIREVAISLGLIQEE